jgi:hypothetical protein
MKTLLSVLCLIALIPAFSQQYSRARVYTNSEGLQQLAEMGIEIDHGQWRKDYCFTSDFSSEDLTRIQQAGFSVELLIHDVQAFYVNQNSTFQAVENTKNLSCPTTSNSTFSPAVPSNFQLGSMGGFYTYQEFLDELDSMASIYPNLISSRAQISSFQSIEGRPIYFVKISDHPNADDAEPEILYTAVHHAREPNSLSEVIFYMWYLLENYNSSAEVKYLVDSTELYFVPMINPDGYIYNETTNPNGGGMWRKNRRLNPGGSYGVDLNRNYSYGWGTTGTSSNQSNDTYCGTSAFSEPETQAIKWFCENRDFVFAFNGHTYGNDILFPIGTTTSEFAADHDYFNTFTKHMTTYNGYTYMKSSSLYPASGDSDDYMYKVDTVIKPKIFAMTPEVSNTSGGFWPAANQITGICQDMVFPNLVLSHLSHQYYAVKDIDPQLISSTSGQFNHAAERLGLENGTVTVSITPLVGIQNVGSPVVYQLNLMEIDSNGINYTLNPGIQFGDEIKYVLNTVYNGWTHQDTITKQFGNINTQFTDVANNASNWTGNWGLSTTTYYSPSSSFTDSPTGNYLNNTTKTFQLNNSIDLTTVSAAMVRFYAKWDIEADYDFCQFQVSTDNGSTWIPQCGKYTVLGTSGSGSVQPNNQPVYEGLQSTWVQEEINLSDYIGSTIKFRFILKSDAGVGKDGFYFDDFEIAYNSTANVDEQTALTYDVYPNPAKSTITIATHNGINKGNLLVLDLNGNTVLNHAISNENSTFSVTNLANGVYTVIMESDGKFSTPSKLVILNN